MKSNRKQITDKDKRKNRVRAKEGKRHVSTRNKQ